MIINNNNQKKKMKSERIFEKFLCERTLCDFQQLI